MPGYSGRPLFAKLGFKPESKIHLANPPEHYRSLLGDDELDFDFGAKPASADFIHAFFVDHQRLDAFLKKSRKQMRSDAQLWISWPKKSSKVPTTITEDVVRELALPIGLVDIKVCAVDEVWSGLKLMIRKELRGDPS